MFKSELAKDYFALFGITKSFEIDAGALAERYRFLQRQAHPDMHASGDPMEKRIALQYSGYVNQAYSTLRDANRRAFYLLELGGFAENEVNSFPVDEEFLFEQMMLRDRISDLCDCDDALSVIEEVTASLERLQVDAEAKFLKFYQQDKLEQAAPFANCLQYLFKMKEELDRSELKMLEKG